jgi:hypothetical protein
MAKNQVKDFLTDEEMAMASADAPDFISDEEMDQKETGGPGGLGNLASFLSSFGESALGGRAGITKPIAAAATGSEESLLQQIRPGMEIGSLAGLEQDEPRFKETEAAISGKIEQLQQASPKSAFAGSIAGGFAPGPTQMLGTAAFGAAAKPLGKVLKPVGKLLGKGAKKIAATTSGVSEDAIDTYSKFTDDVDNLIQQFQGNVPEAVDATKKTINSSVNSAVNSLAQQKQKVLESAANERVSLVPVFDKLREAAESIDKKLYPEAHKAIQKAQNQIVQVAQGFEANPIEADKIKMFLQDMAKSAYQKGGEIIPGGDKASRAFKQAASVARKEVNKAAPDVAAINNRFQQLFDLQGKMNRNILKEGGSEAAFLSAGKEANRNRKNLEKLGDLVGEDFVGKVKKVSAMSEFAQPDLLAKDFTGKAAARAALGGGVGYGLMGPVGATIGALATSPAAVKTAIKAKNIIGKGASKAVRSARIKALGE